MRRLLLPLLAVGVAVALVVGLIQASGGGEPAGAPAFDLDAARAQLAGAPPALAALHDQANRLLDRGFETRLAELKGRPVVVNKWASWCGPCRAEFPVFQRLSTKLGKEVAFLGLNSGDNRDDAAAFLSEYPVPFPSYVDPDGTLSRSNGGSESFPATLFYDRTGERVFVHLGQYRTDADLQADIDRYAR